MSATHQDKTLLWKGFAAALGAELRRDTVIRGSSGLDHAVQAIAVDDEGKRVIVVSAEASPRLAALMQVDVQATMPESRVIVARPIALDIANLARKVLEPIGFSVIDIARAKSYIGSLSQQVDSQQQVVINPATEKIFGQLVGAASAFNLPAVSQITSLVMQAEALPWQEIMELFNETAATGSLDLRGFLATDSMAADLAAGVCPLPLYEFSEQDFELFLSGSRPEDIRARLRELGIYQYFYPAADQVALALIDQGIGNPGVVLEATAQAPGLGHPFGASEIIPTAADMINIVGQLKDMNYVAEGEHGVEISEQGRVVRSLVKFRPRESFVTKLLNRLNLSASISPGDFLK